MQEIYWGHISVRKKKKRRELETVKKSFTVGLMSLKESEKEGATCIKCFRLQCNSRKFAQADRESSSQSIPLKRSCVCRKRSVFISSFAKSLAWCSPQELWPGQEHSGRSRKAIAWVISQLCSLKQESWACIFMATAFIHIPFPPILSSIFTFLKVPD